jgi:hypothetical protein
LKMWKGFMRGSTGAEGLAATIHKAWCLSALLASAKIKGFLFHS